MLCLKDIIKEKFTADNSSEDNVKQFANILRKRGINITKANSWISLNTLTLSQINDGFDLLTKKDLNPLHNIECCDEELVKDLYYLMDVFYFIQALRLTHLVSHTIPGKIDLSKFKNLTTLEFNHVPIHLIVNAHHIKYKLHTLALNKCTQTLENLFTAFEIKDTLCQQHIFNLKNVNTTKINDITPNSTIYQWPSLTTLILRHDNLTNIGLTDIYMPPMHGNKLSEFVSSPSISTSIMILENLKKIDLSNQSLSHTETFLEYLPSLKDVNLSFNCLRSIPSFHDQARDRLKLLNMRNNKLENIEGVEVLSHLINIDISSNVICLHDTLKPIRQLEHLKTLRTFGNPICLHPFHRQLTSAFIHPSSLIETNEDKFMLDERSVTKTEIYSYFTSGGQSQGRNWNKSEPSGTQIGEKSCQKTLSIYSINLKRSSNGRLRENGLADLTQASTTTSTFFAPIPTSETTRRDEHISDVPQVHVAYPINAQDSSTVKSTSSRKTRVPLIREISESRDFDIGNQVFLEGVQNKFENNLFASTDKATNNIQRNEKFYDSLKQDLNEPGKGLKVSKDDIAKIIKNSASPNKGITNLRESLLRDLDRSRSYGKMELASNRTTPALPSHTRHISVDIKRESSGPTNVSSSYQNNMISPSQFFQKRVIDKEISLDGSQNPLDSNDILFYTSSRDNVDSSNMGTTPNLDSPDISSCLEDAQANDNYTVPNRDYITMSATPSQYHDAFQTPGPGNVLRNLSHDQTDVLLYKSTIGSPIVQPPTPYSGNGRPGSFLPRPHHQHLSSSLKSTSRLTLSDKDLTLDEDDTYIDISVVGDGGAGSSHLLQRSPSCSSISHDGSSYGGYGDGGSSSSEDDDIVGEETDPVIVNFIDYGHYERMKHGKGNVSKAHDTYQNLVNDSEVGFITLDERYLREKDTDGKLIKRLDLKLLLSAVPVKGFQDKHHHHHQSIPQSIGEIKNDPLSLFIIRLHFDTKIKCDKRRLYAFDKEESSQQILDMLDKFLKAQYAKKNVRYTYSNPANYQSVVYLQCLKCSHKRLKTLECKDTSSSNCSKCKSSMIVEIEEDNNASLKNSKSVINANFTTSLTPNDSSFLRPRSSSCSSAESVSNSWIEKK